MSDKVQTVVGPEFQSLPLPLILSAAMNGIVSAQMISAKTTADFLRNIQDKEVTFKSSVVNPDTNVARKVDITVPELAVVPVPSIRVDSATIHFNFEIKEVVTEKSETEAGGELKATTKGLLSKIADVSLSGSIGHKNSAESTLNRSGMLDVTIHLSEPPLPEGLSKVLNMLSNAIVVKDSKPDQ